ncbi:MAG: heparinase II/III family protein [Caldilineaceae bacterium]|nr:heparinase II/III family protein [Caldilineaceae bacterium]
MQSCPRFIGFILITILLLAQPSYASSDVDAPQAHAKLTIKTLRQDTSLVHPRLLFTAADIAQLQRESVSTHQEIWSAIEQFATDDDALSVPAAAPVDGGLSTYRNFGNQLIPLAFACIISETQDVCEAAKQMLLTYAEWDQWGNDGQRDLGLAHMMIGNALAYDWLFDRLNAEEQLTVRSALAGWAEEMYQASSGDKVDDWNNWWRKSYAQNHHWINNSALGMVGLALLNEELRAEVWLDQAVTQLQKTQTVLNGVADGSWHEGVHYQDYGLSMTIPFWVSLRANTDIDLIPTEYMQNYVTWRLYNYLPDEWLPILEFGDVEADWESGFRSYSVLRFAAKEYANGTAEWLAQSMEKSIGHPASVWSAAWYVFEYLNYDSDIKPVYPLLSGKSQTFSDIQSVIWRTGWQKNDTVFGLKADGYAGQFLYNSFTQGQELWETPCAESGCELNFGHDHDDTLSFYLYHNGVRMIPEVIGNLARDTSLHNTLLVDGKGQYRPPDNRYRYPEELANTNSSLALSVSTPDIDYLAADATQRYSHMADIQNVSRSVIFVRPDYFIMLDNLAATQLHQYTWVSHFADQVNVEGDWVWSEAETGDRLGVQVASPDMSIDVQNDTDVPVVEVSTVRPVETARFIHLLFPTNANGWEDRPIAKLLNDTGTAVVLQIQNHDARRFTDMLLLRYDDSTDYVSANGLATNAKVALVRRYPSGALRHVFVHGGSFLQDVNAEGVLVENLNAESTFDAKFIGSWVWIAGEIESGVRFYAPDVENVSVNGAVRNFKRAGDYIQLP